MTVTEAAHLASQLSGKLVSDDTIRRLCRTGKLDSTKKYDRYDVDEDSVRSYFS